MEDNQIKSDGSENMSDDDSSYVYSSSSSDDDLMVISYANEEELEQLKEDNRRLLYKNEKLIMEVKNLNQIMRRAKLNYDPSTINLTDHIKLSIDKAISSHPHGRRTKLIGEAIATIALKYREGIAYTPIMNHLKTFLKTKVFSPMRVARLMDLTGGSLNLVGLSLLRSLETNDVHHSSRDSILHMK
jgi:hypothetical protein